MSDIVERWTPVYVTDTREEAERWGWAPEAMYLDAAQRQYARAEAAEAEVARLREELAYANRVRATHDELLAYNLQEFKRAEAEHATVLRMTETLKRVRAFMQLENAPNTHAIRAEITAALAAEPAAPTVTPNQSAS